MVFQLLAWDCGVSIAREGTVVNVYIGPLAMAIGEFHLNTQSHAILNFFLLRWILGEPPVPKNSLHLKFGKGK
jgi:hypothetical protein